MRLGLPSLLVAAGLDLLVITGALAPGCFCTTAVNPFRYDYWPSRLRQAVGDRNPNAQVVNLYDMDAK